MTRTSASAGALVLSLDFELHWGVRDHTPAGSSYHDNLHGARALIPRMLGAFHKAEVAATWATVGLLFARSRAELTQFRPRVLPTYSERRLDPFNEPVGAGEAEDPLHYAPSLIDRIADTPRQELATHTYSHYFCTEPGQTAEQFAADLDAACAIAATRGIQLKSIVFPRNQHNPLYDELLLARGILNYRGNPPSWMWRFTDAAESAGRLKRLARFADAYGASPGDPTYGWDEVLQPNGLANVRASTFLRPYSSRLRRLEPLRIRTLRRAVRNAARRGRLLHLWWHPHNFGAEPDENMRVLRAVLEEFGACRDEYGMLSLSMAELGEACRAGTSPIREGETLPLQVPAPGVTTASG